LKFIANQKALTVCLVVHFAAIVFVHCSNFFVQSTPLTDVPWVKSGLLRMLVSLIMDLCHMLKRFRFWYIVFEVAIQVSFNYSVCSPFSCDTNRGPRYSLVLKINKSHPHHLRKWAAIMTNNEFTERTLLQTLHFLIQ